MASLTGFEPATCCLEGSRSIHLSYRDTLSLSKFNMNRRVGQDGYPSCLVITLRVYVTIYIEDNKDGD